MPSIGYSTEVSWQTITLVIVKKEMKRILYSLWVCNSSPPQAACENHVEIAYSTWPYSGFQILLSKHDMLTEQYLKSTVSLHTVIHVQHLVDCSVSMTRLLSSIGGRGGFLHTTSLSSWYPAPSAQWSDQGVKITHS